MRLFNSAIYASNFHRDGAAYSRLTPEEVQMRESCGNFLESYHYAHQESVVTKIRRDGIKIFLDSGAFSAPTRNVGIDIGKYCDYIHRNADIIEYASVLSVIGDCDGTYRNQVEMERRGVRPLPCFHYGEPTEALDYYIENYEYITIGGMVSISTPQLRTWLDRVWGVHLTDENGEPKIKVHGFGLTSLPLMLRYPWHSVDSSAWAQWAARGMILVPNRVGQIDVSNKSSRRKTKGQHLDAHPEMITKVIEDEIRSFGGDPDRLRDLHYSRWAWNVWAFPKHAEAIKWENVKFTATEQRLF